jgi:hydrogenase maturation protein HypF
LTDTFGQAAPLANVPEDRVRTVRRMIEKGVNTAQTSSCGRLFDAVAAMVGLRQTVTFEGQAAMELETAAEDGVLERYPFEIGGDGPWELDFRPMIERIARDTEGGAAAGVVSARFHNTLALAIVETCRLIRGETKLERVCLSGGTFQNMRLLGTVAPGLREAGFHVFLHAQVPPNDGGIALGQAAIAAAVLRNPAVPFPAGP